MRSSIQHIIYVSLVLYTRLYIVGTCTQAMTVSVFVINLDDSHCGLGILCASSAH